MAFAAMLTTSAGCSSTGTECEGPRQIVAPSSSRGPGAVQLGLFLQPAGYPTPAQPPAALHDGGVVCFTCGGIVVFDAGLHDNRAIDTAGWYAVAVAPDDAIYAVASGAATPEVVALSPAGTLRWRAPVASFNGRLFAGSEGPYVGVSGPGSEPTSGIETVFGFDAATGERRTLVTGQHLLGAGNGRVLTSEPVGGGYVTLHQLDSAGSVLWSSAMVSGELSGVVATPDGGEIVAGPSTDAAGFVIGFSAAGERQWSFSTRYRITHLTLSSQGEILLAGNNDRGAYTPVSSYLSVASPAGIERTLTIHGEGDQYIEGLAAAPDGLAWVQIDNAIVDDGRPGAALPLGGHTFTDTGTYLFKIVP